MRNRNRSIAHAWEKTGYIIAIGIMMILLTSSVIVVLSWGRSLEEARYLKIVISILGMLFAVILFISGCFNTDDDNRQRDKFISASFLLFINIFLSGIIDILDGVDGMAIPLIAIVTISMVIMTAVQLLFWSYQCASLPENGSKRYLSAALYFVVVVYCVLLIINLFTPVLFVVNELGKINYISESIDIIFFGSFYLIYLLYILPQHCPLKKKLSLSGFVVFPIILIVLNVIWYSKGITYVVTPLTNIVLLMSAYVVFFCDYIDSKELILRQKVELVKQSNRQIEMQTALMLSQIRPHFLYNSLTAIRNLCKIDPAEAYLALGDFSDYLRTNMNVLGSGRMTSFKKELEHVKIYLSLEQMRFGEDLKVEYDIQYQDFSLPSLTVQPIVENAVRHGAMMKEDGGRIIIRSIKTEDGAVITVADNGPGFDPSSLSLDNKTHFGLKNVQECLAATGSGALKIDSNSGIGTTVTIQIWEKTK